MHLQARQRAPKGFYSLSTKDTTMDPTNTDEVMAAAKQWWHDLPTSIIRNIAVARVLVNETHGYDSDQPMEGYLRDIGSAIRAHTKDDALGTFSLIAAMAVRAMEQLEREQAQRQCSCPACQLRRLLEEGGVSVDDAQLDAMSNFLRQPAPSMDSPDIRVVTIDSPEQLNEVFARIFNLGGEPKPQL